MYIQQPSGNAVPFVPPRDYSGSAFLPPKERTATPTPPEAELLSDEPAAEPAEAPAEPQKEPLPDSLEGERPTGGLFSGIPFLSSLLPPPRRGSDKDKKEGLPDWAFLALIFFLFMDKGENDLLPLLLLLFLWD